MEKTGRGNRSPSGIKSGEGHEGQQVFCRNISSKRKSEENVELLAQQGGDSGGKERGNCPSTLH